VRDEGRDIRGRAAIRDWAEVTRQKYRFHAEPLSVQHAGEQTTVTARLTGDFPGGPVNLRYRFKLTGMQIMALEIS
jgi:hypothetical protein